MDGPMPKTVLIILAAVVALIVIVVLTGMRYLRADDDDDFDDAPAEHGGARSRGIHPARDEYARRGARHDEDMPEDRLERVGAARGARSDGGYGGDPRPDRRGAARSGQDRSQPGRVGVPARVVYEHDTAGGGRRRDDMDRLDGRDGREPRDRRDARDRMEPRPRAAVREIGDHDARDRRGATRPNARPDAGKTRPDPGKNGARSDRGELLPAVKPRQGKSKRVSDGDWPTSEWDELSDVDYWAELASDKPITTTGPSGQGSRARSRQSRPDARPGPDRRERADGNTAAELAGRQVSGRERIPDRELLPPAARPDPLAASARPSAGRPIPDDDDPLTSPTFPRIAADDSRSYRRTRASSRSTRQSASREHEALQPTRNGGHTTARQAETGSAYPAAPRVESVGGLEATGQMRSYPRPSAGGSGPSATSLPGGQFPASSSVPGSYEMPSVSAAGYEPAAGGYPSTNGYSAPGGISAADYLPPVPGSPAGNGSYGDDATAQGSYLSSDVSGYRAEAGSGAYQGGLPDGYPPASNSASYEGAGGYSLPAHPSDYHNGYPDPAAGYQGYAESGSFPGADLHPESGYPVGGYPGSAEPSLGAPQHGGHGDLGYPAYPPAMPAELGTAYQAQPPQPPGYQDAAFQAAPYDSAGHPAPVHEANGYGAADPYAVDPYGQPGYGGFGY
jgi:hypothetical protein